MSANWQDILNKKPEDAEKPKPTPTGTFLATIVKYEFKEAKNDKQTPYVQYHVKLISPEADVDMQSLNEAGGMEKVSARVMYLDFYMTDDSMWRHRDFLEKTLGINFAGRGWQPVIDEALNKNLRVHVAQTISKKDNATIYSNIDDTAAA